MYFLSMNSTNTSNVLSIQYARTVLRSGAARFNHVMAMMFAIFIIHPELVVYQCQPCCRYIRLGENKNKMSV
jgi:hypothetical protein